MAAMIERLNLLLSHYPGRADCPEHQVKALLKDCGLRVPRGLYLAAEDRLPDRLDLAWPLVAKVVSRAITAKSDRGGVRLGIATPAELAEACRGVLALEGAEGVLIEEMAPSGVEVIVGGVVDPQFGPLVMFGLGGLLVELFRDVAFSLAPVTPEEAQRLMRQPKGGVLIDGFRGKPPLDRDALAGIIVTVSRLIGSGLLEEVDLNPVVVYPSGAVVLDAKMRKRE